MHVYAEEHQINKIAFQGKRLRVDREAIGLSRVQQFFIYSIYMYMSPALLRYLPLLFLNIFTLLTFTQSIDNLFHLFTVLFENEYFLIFNLH